MTARFYPHKIALSPDHWIAGERVPGEPRLPHSCPSDGSPLPPVPVADEALVDRAVETAHQGWRKSGWGAAHPRDRVRVLQAWAELVSRDAETLTRLEIRPSTRLIREVPQIDLPISVEQIRFFAEMADKEGGALAPTASDHLGMVIPEPYGVIAAITPWNYPLSMAVWKLAPALAAGNAVVLKPSEMTPYTAIRLAELAEAAGVPKGLITVLQGSGPTTGAALVRHPKVGKVSFTGSTRAGAAIQENIAKTGIKPVTLELGGKSPQIVFADADRDRAIDCVARGFLPNAGQTCVAGTRLMVHESLADALIAGVIDRARALRPGPAWDPETTLSPLISEAQCARVETILAAAKAKGAETLHGGARLDHPGSFFAPTVLTGLTEENPAITEEIFAPVLTVQTFRDEAQALALADHPTYGLCAGVHTTDMSRAIRVTRALEAGTVWVNRYGRSRDHILPTGGYKSSGLGKDLGREAYHGALRMKSVLMEV